MILKLKNTVTKKEYDEIIRRLTELGLEPRNVDSNTSRVLNILGDTSSLDVELVRGWPGVDTATRIQVPYKLASRETHPEDTIIDVSGVLFGGNNFPIIAGPCSVESKEQILEVALAVKQSGAKMLRGGAYKPRTSPYAFQGLALDGLDLLVYAREITGLPIVTEIPSVDLIPRFVKDVDLIQVGARNMQNFDLLKALGKIDKPILLKRGLANTIDEWLMAAEYILAGGNQKVILCERGIRTFEKYTRNTLDLSAVLAAKKLSHLPVIVDPSHGTGRWEMVEPMSKASLACGADGLIIEVHNNPEFALSDGAQSLKPKRFDALMEQLRKIAPIVGKVID